MRLEANDFYENDFVVTYLGFRLTSASDNYRLEYDGITGGSTGMYEPVAQEIERD